MQKQGEYTPEHIERLLHVIDANKDGKVRPDAAFTMHAPTIYFAD